VHILAQFKTSMTEIRSIHPLDGVVVVNVKGGPIFDQLLPDKSF
jgi:hypothetical protein